MEPLFWNFCAYYDAAAPWAIICAIMQLTVNGICAQRLTESRTVVAGLSTDGSKQETKLHTTLEDELLDGKQNFARPGEV